ncbi:transcriptional regulator with XRE-family HTH domain [Clostridium beijerinckii]|uniref:helix-turn-helix domain-containing protein n=1 Tax=Clostridium beijerinckii TaxID=1520 RepID=UPI00149468C4|nr:transcriptional regulator with XRE-family HTH domain [Clostridium beijerinckii]
MEKYEGLSLGEFLRKLRIDKGKTINSMQNETGISKSYLSKLENNTKDNPSLDILKKLSNYYNVPFQVFQNLCNFNTGLEDEQVKDISELVINMEYLFANMQVDIEFKLLFKNFIILVENIISSKEAGRAEEFKVLELLDELKRKLDKLNREKII